MKVPPATEVTTTRLSLRRFRQADAAAFFAYRSDPSVCRFQSWRPSSIEEIEAFIAQQSRVPPNEAGTWIQLAVCSRGDGTLVGDCGIHFGEDEPDQAEIGYTIAPAFQGRGYGTEAVRAVLGYLFQELRKHRVWASVDPRNEPSIALLRRLGMRQEAHFIKNYRSRDGWDDTLVFAILDEEWNCH